VLKSRNRRASDTIVHFLKVSGLVGTIYFNAENSESLIRSLSTTLALQSSRTGLLSDEQHVHFVVVPESERSLSALRAGARDLARYANVARGIADTSGRRGSTVAPCTNARLASA